jgi:hypothetical protein
LGKRNGTGWNKKKMKKKKVDATTRTFFRDDKESEESEDSEGDTKTSTRTYGRSSVIRAAGGGQNTGWAHRTQRGKP